MHSLTSFRCIQNIRRIDSSSPQLYDAGLCIPLYRTRLCEVHWEGSRHSTVIVLSKLLDTIFRRPSWYVSIEPVPQLTIPKDVCHGEICICESAAPCRVLSARIGTSLGALAVPWPDVPTSISDASTLTRFYDAPHRALPESTVRPIVFYKFPTRRSR